eukprot:g2049.t1
MRVPGWLLLCAVLLGDCVPSAQAGCNCWTCDGRPASYTATCIGRSRGCDVGDPHGGCYGQQAAEPWHSGVCHCRTGQFRFPELYSIHGNVQGLNAGHTVKIACSSPKVLGARFGNSAIMAADVSWDGRFSFPYKLARGQTFDVFVLNHPPAQKCSVTKSSSGTITRNVVDLTVVCKNIGGGGGGSRSGARVVSHSSQSRLPASMQQSVAATSKRLRPGACARYDEVATLPVRKSPLPCSRGFDLASEHRDFQTEIKGHPCASFSVSASAPIIACFVPRRTWDSLGRAAVMADSHLCTCKGKTSCSGGHKMGKSPYVLYVAPADPSSEGKVHIDVALSKCGGKHKMLVYCAAGVGLLAIIAMGPKKGGGGGGGRRPRNRMAMHNRL